MEEDTEALLGGDGGPKAETEWGLRLDHLKSLGSDGVARAMPPAFPFSHYMYTLLRKLSFHPERYAQFLVSVMKTMSREFFVGRSKVFYFREPASEIYQIMSGQITLHIGRVRGGGRESFRVKLGPGDWFGWEALLKGNNYRVTEAKCVGNVFVWSMDASVFKKQLDKDDDLRRDLNDAWLAEMTNTVRAYTMMYFAPDLSENRLYNGEFYNDEDGVHGDDDRLVAQEVLVDTMTTQPEVVRKERKTVEDKIEDIEDMINASTSQAKESVMDLKLELPIFKAEVAKGLAEITKMLKK